MFMFLWSSNANQGEEERVETKRSVLAEYFDRAQQLGGRNVKYTISSSFGFGATSRGNSDKCCFSYLKACSTFGVQWKSLFLMQTSFKVLFAAQGLFRGLGEDPRQNSQLPPLRLSSPSLIIRGDWSCSTSLCFIWNGFYSYRANLCTPTKIPSIAPKSFTFLGVDGFMLIFRLPFVHQSLGELRLLLGNSLDDVFTVVQISGYQDRTSDSDIPPLAGVKLKHPVEPF
ncbi:hypothetical protein Tco_0174019 [Tanacetum coccineum]